jgi:hypothetical protein
VATTRPVVYENREQDVSGWLSKPRLSCSHTPPPEVFEDSSNDLGWTTVAHTNDDVVKRLVKDLVNGSKHDDKQDGIKVTTNKGLYMLRTYGEMIRAPDEDAER